jgi:23S rRNA-/tRNA-specific pseudouridylate synthase
MELQTLYKNEILWAVNKPSRTHFNEILPHGVRGLWTPAHRLDFETSGVLLHCPTNQFELVSSLFKDPSNGLQKYYLVGTQSPLQCQVPGMIKGLIASRYRRSKSVKFIFDKSEARGWHSLRPAQIAIDQSPKITQIAKELGFGGTPYEIRLITGARHQIRATLEALEAPIVGDPIYGPQPPPKDLAMELHAHRLVIPAESKILKLEAPIEIIASKIFRLEAGEQA